MGLVAFPCGADKPLSWVADDGEVLGGSHAVVAEIAGVLWSAVHPAALLPGISCSSIAKATMSACSDVNVNVPKEPDEALMPCP